MKRITKFLLPVVAFLASVPALASGPLDCDSLRHDDQLALACNIYHEARNESLAGQMAVAHVTRNRAQSAKFPNTFREVVWQYKVIRYRSGARRVAQFSWTRDGMPDTVFNKKAWNRAVQIASLFTLSNEEKKSMCAHEYKAYQTTKRMNAYLRKEYGLKRPTLVFSGCEASRLAQKMRNYNTQELMGDVTGGAQYYHAHYVNPWWAKKFEHTVRIDAHLFYASYSK